MGEPKMVRSVTIDKELVKFRFLGDLEECGLQLLLVLGYAYGVDNSHDNIGDFVCPIMNNAFYLYFHTPLFNGFMLCGCSLRYHSHILLHQGEYLLVVLGVLVAHATTLHHFHRFQ